MEDAPFQDRGEAGRLLAKQLAAYGDRDDVVVLALPRGGVPVADEIARALGAPLDVFLVRKLVVPGHEQLELGAITSGGARVGGPADAADAPVAPAEVDAIAARELAEIERRERAYRGDLGPLALHARTVILVDDGLATGATMRAALQAVRRADPAKTVVAVPVSAPDVRDRLRDDADDVICLRATQTLRGVGGWYEDFSRTSDEDVRALLARAGGQRRDELPPA